MTGRRRRRTFSSISSSGLLAFFVFLVSCVSSQVSEKLYTREELQAGRAASFSLEPFSITSYDFAGEEEIRAIMDRKIVVALMSEPDLSVVEQKDSSGPILFPELIVKHYQQRYVERYYFLLSVKVMRAGELLSQYTYEYNGTSSIFDGKVQTALIKRFVDDFARHATRR
jgi:hypothetical protein